MDRYHENSIRLEHAFKDAILRLIENEDVKSQALFLCKADFFDQNSVLQIIHLLESITSSTITWLDTKLFKRIKEYREYLENIRVNLDIEKNNPRNYSVRYLEDYLYQQIVDECVNLLKTVKFI